MMSFQREILGLLLVMAVFVPACRRAPSGIIVSCAGDSLTERGYPRYLRAALGRRGVRARVFNHGRSGNTTREYLAYLDGAAGEIGKERPDFVLIGLGTNDVRVDGDHVTGEEFAKNLRSIVAVFREFRNRSGDRPEILLAAAPPVPHGTPYPFGPGSADRVTREINPAIRAVAESLGAGFVDNYSPLARAPELLPEVHPLPEGYRIMAENWAAAIASRLEGRGRGAALHLPGLGDKIQSSPTIFSVRQKPWRKIS